MASDAVVNLIVNAANADRDVDVSLRRIVNDAERNAPPIVLNVTIDNRQVNEVTNNIVNQFGEIRRAGDDADSSGSRFGRTLSSLGSSVGSLASIGARMGAIGVAAAGSVPLVAGLATALTTIAPAAAAGATAFVGLQLASGTLKVALSGVQDAISAVFDPDSDPAAVAEAMERLAPEAQKFVRELQRMKPAFSALRLDLQNRLFKGLDDQLSDLSRAVMPDVSRSSRQMATIFNDAARGIVAGAQQLRAEGSLGKALDSSTTAFGNLSRVPGQVLLAIGRLAAAGGPLLIRFSTSIGEAFDRLSERMSAAVESGALEDAVNSAGDALAQLGRVAGNIGEIIGNVFGAAQLSGEGLFGALEKVTQALADVTASTAFQEALGALIEVGTQLVDSVLPILMAAFEALLPVIEILAPPIQELIRVLGEELLGLIPELQPVLIEMAGAFTAIIEAVIPLLPPLASLIKDLLPLLIFFFRGVAVIVENVLAPVLLILVEGLAVLVSAFRRMAGETMRDYVIPIIETFIALLNGDMTSAQQAAAGVTRRFIDSQIQAFSRFGVSVKNFAVEFVAQLQSGANRGAQAFLSRVREMIGQAGRFLGQLPGIARSQLAGLAGVLVSAGRSLIQGFVNGMLSQIGSVRSAASSLVGAARDFFPFSPAKRGPFSGTGYTTYSGRKLVEDFGKGIQQRKVSLQQIISSVLGNAATGFGIQPELALAGPRSTSLASLTAGSLERLTPVVNVDVRVGNEQLNPFIDTRIEGNNASRDRDASQGTRF